jgi:hypothetical protein
MAKEIATGRAVYQTNHEVFNSIIFCPVKIMMDQSNHGLERFRNFLDVSQNSLDKEISLLTSGDD